MRWFGQDNGVAKVLRTVHRMEGQLVELRRSQAETRREFLDRFDKLDEAHDKLYDQVEANRKDIADIKTNTEPVITAHKKVSEAWSNLPKGVRGVIALSSAGAGLITFITWLLGAWG